MPPIPGVGKRFALSIEKKIEVLKEIDGNKRSRNEIAKAFNIPRSSLSTILKNREKIFAASKAGLSGKRSRTTEAKFPEMEKAILEWLKAMRQKNMPVDGNILKAKADVFALRMDIQDFKASDGWLQRFKLRHGLSFRKLCGESASVDLKSTDAWKEGRLQRLLQDYAPEDVFNADETGLFYKLLPDRSLVFKDEKCSGGKRAKQRITVLLTANMTGTQKLVPLIIGKSAKPRCFKGIRTLPAKYKANSKAWMTFVIYEEWLRDFDRKMTQKGRKVLLIIDNCSSHKEVDGLLSVRVEFLPPNATSVIQPLDQGIIQAFKKHYRAMLLNRVILCLETGSDYNIDVLGAIHLTVEAWGKVTEQTIANCFRHAGFVRGFSASAAPATDASLPDLSADAEGEEFFEQLGERLPVTGLDFAAYAEIDASVQTSEELSEETIIEQAIRTARNDSQDSDDNSSEDEDNGLGPVEPRPTVKQAAEAAVVMRRFFEGQENSEEFLAIMMKAEERVLKSVRLFKQSNIADYFSRGVLDSE